MYETKILNKSSYKYKPDEQTLGNSSKTDRSTSSKKKSIIDRLPRNIFAVEKTVADSFRLSSRDRTSVSISKQIK